MLFSAWQDQVYSSLWAQKWRQHLPCSHSFQGHSLRMLTGTYAGSLQVCHEMWDQCLSRWILPCGVEANKKVAAFFLPGTPSIIPAGSCGEQKPCCWLAQHHSRLSVSFKLPSIKCQNMLLTQSQPEQVVRQKRCDSCELRSWEAVQQQLFCAASRTRHDKEH